MAQIQNIKVQSLIEKKVDRQSRFRRTKFGTDTVHNETVNVIISLTSIFAGMLLSLNQLFTKNQSWDTQIKKQIIIIFRHEGVPLSSQFASSYFQTAKDIKDSYMLYSMKRENN